MAMKVKTHGRFDYVAYDDKSKQIQSFLKEEFGYLEKGIEQTLKDSRYKSLAITKLEEAYMYIGKAIRDEQIERNNGAELQEERSNS